MPLNTNESNIHNETYAQRIKHAQKQFFNRIQNIYKMLRCVIYLNNKKKQKIKIEFYLRIVRVCCNSISEKQKKSN